MAAAAWVPEWPGRVAPTGWSRSKPGELWTRDHFKRWTSRLVFEDGEPHDLQDWQLEVFDDLVDGFTEIWLAVPQGNSKTTFMSAVALYHLDNTRAPWVPVAASSRDQAEILYGQAKGFVERTTTCDHWGEQAEQRCQVCGAPTLEWNRHTNDEGPFHLAGTRQIRHTANDGPGLKVYASDVETADGVIPTLAFVDEGHRLKDLGVYRTWRGKLRKRRGQIMMISTAGEPGSDFEVTRDALKAAASDHGTVERREPAYGRYATSTTVLHDYAVPDITQVEDLAVVKAANPLSTITELDLQELRASPTLDLGEDWLRLTCNVPARSTKAAVSDGDWIRAAQHEFRNIPEGQPVAVGADFAWVLDTTALVPLWIRDPLFRLLGPARILVPPRDGNMLDPQEVHDAFLEIHARNPIMLVVMDRSRAEETAMWLAEEIGCEVVDRTQANSFAAEDYEAFMRGLRRRSTNDNPQGGWLRHCGDAGLRSHVMNAIARKLTADRYRFDRETPSRARAKQDARVIDALSAAGMVVQVTDAALGLEEPQPMVAVGRAR